MTTSLKLVLFLFFITFSFSMLNTTKKDKNKETMFTTNFDENKTINYEQENQFVSLKSNDNVIKRKETKNKNNHSAIADINIYTKNKFPLSKNCIKTLNMTKLKRSYKPVPVAKPLHLGKDRKDISEAESHIIHFRNFTTLESKEKSYYLDTEEDTEETSSEMARGEEVEREANKLKKHLFALEELLYETFEEVPIGRGDSLIKDLIQYNKELNEFLNLSQSDKANTYGVVKDYLDPNNPLPPVAKFEFSGDLFKNKFGWSDKKYEYFKQIYKNTTETYLDLQLFHHEFPYR